MNLALKVTLQNQLFMNQKKPDSAIHPTALEELQSWQGLL